MSFNFDDSSELDQDELEFLFKATDTNNKEPTEYVYNTENKNSHFVQEKRLEQFTSNDNRPNCPKANIMNTSTKNISDNTKEASLDKNIEQSIPEGSRLRIRLPNRKEDFVKRSAVNTAFQHINDGQNSKSPLKNPSLADGRLAISLPNKRLHASVSTNPNEVPNKIQNSGQRLDRGLKGVDSNINSNTFQNIKNSSSSINLNGQNAYVNTLRFGNIKDPETFSTKESTLRINLPRARDIQNLTKNAPNVDCFIIDDSDDDLELLQILEEQEKKSKLENEQSAVDKVPFKPFGSNSLLKNSKIQSFGTFSGLNKNQGMSQLSKSNSATKQLPITNFFNTNKLVSSGLSTSNIETNNSLKVKQTRFDNENQIIKNGDQAFAIEISDDDDYSPEFFQRLDQLDREHQKGTLGKQMNENQVNNINNSFNSNSNNSVEHSFSKGKVNCFTSNQNVSMNSNCPGSDFNGSFRKGFVSTTKYKPPERCYERDNYYVPLRHDEEAVKTWVYPTNYPVRDYQFNIVEKALHENTLVSLPTGLGKTFIAAVVMFNYYRWFPDLKVVFMAPTKPLVAQQIESCYKVCGINQDDSAELTGALAPHKRREIWQTKRVFYLTPQVFENDLNQGICAPSDFSLIVVDEAHRAQKGYSYVKVIKAVFQQNPLFRVLALSATPGTTLDNVQDMVSNINIARIEIRTEDALDILPYTFKKSIEKVIVPLSPQIIEISELFKKLLTPHLNKLKQRNAFWSNDPDQISYWGLFEARKSFRARSNGGNRYETGAVEGDFALCISMVHQLEHLQKYGLTTFNSKLKEYVHESIQSTAKYKKQLLSNPEFLSLVNKVEDIIKQPDYVSSFSSHPKLKRLVDYVKSHFEKDRAVKKPEDPESKVMIFAHFRETIDEIIQALSTLGDLVRSTAFIGQSSGKSGKGLKQKEQIEAIRKFKNDEYNTLVCSSIGEEGLDIGEVDLIICYDSNSSPIRMLQRIGRTGRRRQGKVCMLLTKGKEERSFGNSKFVHKSVVKAIQSGKIKYFEQNPRMLPEGIIPECVKRPIIIPPYIQPSSKSGRMRTNTSNISIGEPYELTVSEKREFEEIFGDYPKVKLCLKKYSSKQDRPTSYYAIQHSSRTNQYINIIQRCKGLRNPNKASSNDIHLTLNTKSLLDPNQKKDNIVMSSSLATSDLQSFILPSTSVIVDNFNSKSNKLVLGPNKKCIKKSILSSRKPSPIDQTVMEISDQVIKEQKVIKSNNQLENVSYNGYHAMTDPLPLRSNLDSRVNTIMERFKAFNINSDNFEEGIDFSSLNKENVSMGAIKEITTRDNSICKKSAPTVSLDKSIDLLQKFKAQKSKKTLRSDLDQAVNIINNDVGNNCGSSKYTSSYDNILDGLSFPFNNQAVIEPSQNNILTQLSNPFSGDFSFNVNKGISSKVKDSNSPNFENYKINHDVVSLDSTNDFSLVELGVNLVKEEEENKDVKKGDESCIIVSPLLDTNSDRNLNIKLTPRSEIKSLLGISDKPNSSNLKAIQNVTTQGAILSVNSNIESEVNDSSNELDNFSSPARPLTRLIRGSRLNNTLPQRGIKNNALNDKTESRKKRKKINKEIQDMLMELEAEESGEENRHDSEGDRDEYSLDGSQEPDLEGFVCGDHEATQIQSSVNMQAFYRQSLLTQSPYKDVAAKFATRPNMFGYQKAGLRYLGRFNAHDTTIQEERSEEEEEQDESFVVDDDAPLVMDSSSSGPSNTSPILGRTRSERRRLAHQKAQERGQPLTSSQIENLLDFDSDDE